ncbi:putative transporter [Ectothiorhodospira sp. PHS-1]|uniref:C4-dicarboxylic acid transporter DauA n=1 Tax=Ectothiorhodospira sp. PHS-1 TaxID=519989 RepID=UPI00024A8998|nr:C4-dicarboxylic acid transporter DauA [Ectothiorhodospira sp. PHS-1]EHQ51926.1 putative transporter [Ectothiorhodospira sp. PHS-1]
MHNSPWSGRMPGLFMGLRAAWKEGYGLADLRKDVMAGLTIGIVAVPLAMALAIAVGVPPQHGLYTAIVAGAIIALTGGSRFNVSGPTAAFVVILIPVVQQYGLGGLLVATVMAGLILIALGLTRMGALIQFVPYPVVLGFTAGIAVVIATLQLPDFLGLTVDHPGEHYLANLGSIVSAFPSINPMELGVGIFTLLILIFWGRLKVPVPAPLVALVAAALATWALNHWLGGGAVDTIASRFTWEYRGESGQGIPPIPPAFALPWHLPGPDGQPLQLNFDLIRALLGPAFAIAMLGAIESLLCAVVADGLSRTRHDPNSELIGQGLGNVVAPFFGGITATGAIARTATNIRSGARSPIAAVVHALVVLIAVVGLAGVLGHVPMAALAALLFMVAWNMSEAHLFARTIRSAPRPDVAILLICFGLTVLFDMVLAVAVGMGLAAALFIHRMSLITHSDRVQTDRHPDTRSLPAAVALYDVNGPLFFGAAEKAMSSLRLVDPGVKVVMLDMRDVPSMDGTALVALQSLITDLRQKGIALIFVGMKARLIVKLRRAGVRKEAGGLTYVTDMEEGARVARRWLG